MLASSGFAAVRSSGLGGTSDTGSGGSGVRCIKPGIKKLAGDIDPVELMAVHPVVQHTALAAAHTQLMTVPSFTACNIAVFAGLATNIFINDRDKPDCPCPPRGVRATANPLAIPVCFSRRERVHGAMRLFACTTRFWKLTLLAGWALGLAGAPRAAGVEPSPQARYGKAYREQLQRWAASPTNMTLGWEMARACFDLADNATNDLQRAVVAQEGISAARRVVAQAPEMAPAHYYLALNLGQLARTRGLTALKLVSEMETELKTALKLDAIFDYAGADRALGIVYRDTPGWPLSVGSKTKSRQHLRQAVALCPEYPESRLYLLETYLKWGEHKNALIEAKATAAMLPAAHQKFTGEQWASSWVDWERWWKRLQAQVAEPPKTAVSPRGGG